MSQTDKTACRPVIFALTGVVLIAVSAFAGVSRADAKVVRDFSPSKLERVPALRGTPFAEKPWVAIIRDDRPSANAGRVPATRGHH